MHASIPMCAQVLCEARKRRCPLLRQTAGAPGLPQINGNQGPIKRSHIQLGATRTKPSVFLLLTRGLIVLACLRGVGVCVRAHPHTYPCACSGLVHGFAIRLQWDASPPAEASGAIPASPNQFESAPSSPHIITHSMADLPHNPQIIPLLLGPSHPSNHAISHLTTDFLDIIEPPHHPPKHISPRLFLMMH